MERYFTIGDLARRTGLTVKTIRFYADRGIVPPTCRNAAGHRLYDDVALARLELVRTLRELGIDLPTIRKVVTREVPLPEVAAAHAEAVAVQIRILRLRHAVLTTMAERGTTPEEMDVTHHQAERRHLIQDFLDSVLDDRHAGIRTTMTPELPDDPRPDQLAAWTELTGLISDPGFRTHLRTMVAQVDFTAPPRPDLGATVRMLVAPALNLAPDSPEADDVVTDLRALGPADELLTRLDAMNDPRRDRYFELLATINDWPPPEPLTPSLTWAAEALRA
ncbi:MerR family transcriptional regulator [Nonomuraea sp. NPDC049421]|uniref:MerR family transcriptional regulator n=1 Tax=Nonomuraea sp. NPDC049421 TaxID=3155275 RepID=UPI0034203209